MAIKKGKPRKFITIQTLAARWHVSASTVKRLIDEGKLTGIKIRRTYKIDITSADTYEKENKF